MSICKKHFDTVSLSNCETFKIKQDPIQNDFSMFEQPTQQDDNEALSQVHNNDIQSGVEENTVLDDGFDKEIFEELNLPEFNKLEATSKHTDTDEEDIWDFYIENDALERFPRAVLEDEDLPWNVDITDSGPMPIYDINVSDKSIPSHLFFNTDCHLLRRNRQPITGNDHSRRMLQNTVATSKGNSVPLLYPDAMLFSTIFYKSEEDGSYPGSLCSSLLSDDQNKRFGFATVVDHMMTRLKIFPCCAQLTKVTFNGCSILSTITIWQTPILLSSWIVV